MIIELPWPAKGLSPNARLHWAVKARATKQYRQTCFYLTKMQKLTIDWPGDIHLFVTFYPPDRRHYDDDGLASRFKSGRDGIADALGLDDVRFRQHPFLSDQVVKGGKVVVRIAMENLREDQHG